MAQYEILIKTDITDQENKNLATDKKTEQEKALAKTNQTIESAVDYMIVSTAKNVVMNVVPEFVRDSRVVDRINFAMNMAQTVTAFAVNPILGVAHLTTQVANDLIGYTLASRRERLGQTINLERAGYLNRSR